MVVPVVEDPQVVRSDQEEQPSPGKLRGEFPQRLDGVGDALALHLQVAHRDPRQVAERQFAQFQPRGVRSGDPVSLQGVPPRGQHDRAIRGQSRQCRHENLAVGSMRRVKCPTEHQQTGLSRRFVNPRGTHVYSA